MSRERPVSPVRTQKRILGRLFSYDQQLTDLALKLVLGEEIFVQDQLDLKNAIQVKEVSVRLVDLLSWELDTTERNALLALQNYLQNSESEISRSRMHSFMNERFSILKSHSISKFSNEEHFKSLLEIPPEELSCVEINWEKVYTRWPEREKISFTIHDDIFKFARFLDLNGSFSENDKRSKINTLERRQVTRKLYKFIWWLAYKSSINFVFMENKDGIEWKDTINGISPYAFFDTPDGKDLLKDLFILWFEGMMPALINDHGGHRLRCTPYEFTSVTVPDKITKG